MKKIIIALIIVAIVGLGAWKLKSTEENSETSDKQVIKIGATLPLTGDAAIAGQAIKTVLEMRLQELKSKGLKSDYQLVLEDNQMSPQKVAITTNKMINIDKVVAVLSFWGFMGNVAADVADKNHVMSFSCTFGDLSNRGKYGYNIAPVYKEQARTMLNELKRRGIKTVALFVDNTEITDQYNELEKQIKEDGNIEVVFREQVNPGEKDYKMAIIKASAEKPDMYLISGYAPSPYLFMKQLKEITGRNDNATSIDTFSEIFPRDMVEGLWYADSNQGGTTELLQKLAAYSPNTVPSSCLGSMAASLEILVDAIEETQSVDNDVINKWIISNVKNYPSSTGVLNADNNGKIKTPVTIKIIRDGKPTELK